MAPLGRVGADDEVDHHRAVVDLARLVDHVDDVRDPADRVRDEQLLLVGGDDDGDVLALDHEDARSGLRGRVPSPHPGIGDDRRERPEE